MDCSLQSCGLSWGLLTLSLPFSRASSSAMIVSTALRTKPSDVPGLSSGLGVREKLDRLLECQEFQDLEVYTKRLDSPG